MNPIVEAGIIAAGAALISSLLTGSLAVMITHAQNTSTERIARQNFMSERQADAYVVLCDEVSRIEAWASIAIEHAQGRQSSLEPVEALTGDRWFDMQGRLRVFGSRMVRDEFDMMMGAARRLQVLQIKAVQDQPGEPSEALAASQELHTHAARVRTIVSVEVGPLRDLLVKRWWHFRKRYQLKRVLTAQERYSAQYAGAEQEHQAEAEGEPPS